MNKDASVNEERRRAHFALAGVVGAAVLIVAGQAVVGSAIGEATDIGEQLLGRAANSGQVVAGAAISAIGQTLLVLPLLLLFDAAGARTGGRMDRFRLLVLLGPPVLGVAAILTALGFDAVAKDFATLPPVTGEAAEDAARDLFADSVLVQVSTGLGFAGILATIFGVIYSALWAMRTGLLTRFWGTLGMAFGAFFLLGALAPQLAPVGLLGTLFFLLHVALVASGRWPGAQPPAWEAGVAVPWDERDAERYGAPPPPPEEEPARPEDFEGSGRESGEDERPGRRDNKRKRKRKQRGR